MAPGAADRLVSELSALEAAEIAAESMGAEELRALDLDPPRVRARVFGEDAEDGEALADVSLGVADPERGIAARREGDPRVYWLDYALAEELPVSLEAFRNRFVSAEEAPGDEAAAGAEAAAGGEAAPGAAGVPAAAEADAETEAGAGSGAVATPSSDAPE